LSAISLLSACFERLPADWFMMMMKKEEQQEEEEEEEEVDSVVSSN
jgi:hypothetical protein